MTGARVLTHTHTHTICDAQHKALLAEWKILVSWSSDKTNRACPTPIGAFLQDRERRQGFPDPRRWSAHRHSLWRSGPSQRPSAKDDQVAASEPPVVVGYVVEPSPPCPLHYFSPPRNVVHCVSTCRFSFSWQKTYIWLKYTTTGALHTHTLCGSWQGQAVSWQLACCRRFIRNWGSKPDMTAMVVTEQRATATATWNMAIAEWRDDRGHQRGLLIDSKTRHPKGGCVGGGQTHRPPPEDPPP